MFPWIYHYDDHIIFDKKKKKETIYSISANVFDQLCFQVKLSDEKECIIWHLQSFL